LAVHIEDTAIATVPNLRTFFNTTQMDEADSEQREAEEKKESYLVVVKDTKRRVIPRRFLPHQSQQSSF